MTIVMISATKVGILLVLLNKKKWCKRLRELKVYLAFQFFLKSFFSMPTLKFSAALIQAV